MTAHIALPHTGLRVPHTDLAVTSLRHMPTPRGLAYTATLRLSGSIVGTVEDAGSGGGPIFRPRNTATFGYDEINTYAAQCQTSWGNASTESVLGDLVEEYNTQRTINRHRNSGHLVCRRMQPITTGVTALVQRDLVTITYGPAPRSSAERTALARFCADLTGEDPGDLWQAWNPTEQRWTDLLAAPRPS